MRTRIFDSSIGSRSAIASLAALVIALAFAVGGYASADEEDGSCYYEGQDYPNGYEMCQGDSLLRCEEGDWSPIGTCD